MPVEMAEICAISPNPLRRVDNVVGKPHNVRTWMNGWILLVYNSHHTSQPIELDFHSHVAGGEDGSS